MKPKPERSLKYVIKGLPIDYEISKIKAALTKNGIAPIQVNQLKSFKKDRCPLPLFLVAIESKNEVKTKFTNLSQLNNINIEIEAHHPKNFR